MFALQVYSPEVAACAEEDGRQMQHGVFKNVLLKLSLKKDCESRRWASFACNVNVA